MGARNFKKNYLKPFPTTRASNGAFVLKNWVRNWREAQSAEGNLF